jgi:hypothetical protein
MNQKPEGHVKSSDEYSDVVDDELTYFAEHEGEDKSAGRSVSRLEESVYRDPKLRCRKEDAKAQKDYSQHSNTTLDVRQLPFVLRIVVTARRTLCMTLGR